MPKILFQTNIKADIAIVFDMASSIDLHKIATTQTREETIAGKAYSLIVLPKQSQGG